MTQISVLIFGAMAHGRHFHRANDSRGEGPREAIICLTDMGFSMDWLHHRKQVTVNDFKGYCAVIGR